MGIDIMVMPPEGEDYGFPMRLILQEEELHSFDMRDWLIIQGYPQELIEEFDEDFYVAVEKVH